MKLSIPQSELAQIATTVQRAASTRDTVPVLSGLLLKATHEEGLTLTATDLELAITSSTQRVQVLEEGTVLLNARYFTDMVRYLPDIDLHVSTDPDQSRLTVSYGRSQTNFNLYHAEEFPDVTVPEENPYLTLSQNRLKEMLRKTSFACAQNHFKQVFTGVLFDIDGDQMRVVASDTHRLALMATTLEEPVPEPKQFVVPARTINELIRTLDDSDTPISIGFLHHSVVFSRKENNFHILSRLLEGQYPNYLPVIPKNFVSSLTIDTKELEDVLERAVLMPADRQTSKQPIRHIVLQIQDNEIRISAYSQKMGEMQEVLENVSIEGDNNLQIAFNTRYFLDVIKVLQAESPSIMLKLTGSLSPALIQHPENSDYLYVLVPLITT